jgi:hypothetical protein
MISNRKNCNKIEIHELKIYLSQTPVAWLASEIDKGVKVSKGEITPLLQVGKLRTIWSELGGIHSIIEHGHDKFLVCQVMQTLRNPCCNDKKALYLIEEYMQLFASRRLEIKVTLLEQDLNIIICDGNKRAVACYEYSLEKGNANFSLPVYIISKN